MSGCEEVSITASGHTASVSRAALASYSPFLSHVMNSVNVCQCEPMVIIMTLSVQSQQLQEAVSVVSGRFLVTI